MNLPHHRVPRLLAATSRNQAPSGVGLVLDVVRLNRSCTGRKGYGGGGVRLMKPVLFCFGSAAGFRVNV